jgi:hypothetical protein
MNLFELTDLMLKKEEAMQAITKPCAACIDAAEMHALGWDDYYCNVHGRKEN